jgi:hypothetical protein
MSSRVVADALRINGKVIDLRALPAGYVLGRVGQYGGRVPSAALTAAPAAIRIGDDVYAIGAVADGEYLTRSGGTIVGAAGGGGGGGGLTYTQARAAAWLVG